MSREAMQMALEALESDPISHAGPVTVLSPGKGTGFNYFRALGITSLRQALETEPEALRLADALDAEFVQGRISNSTGRESAVELRRLALKQWVGLTAPEVQECYDLNPARFASRIEAKLKEKNHG